MMLNYAALLELAHYDPDTGYWTSLKKTRGRKANIRIDTHITPGGYLHVQFKKKRYPAARLAWLYMTGQWPTHYIDHKNHNTFDNRWVNLREATQTQNNGNARRRSDNTSGFKRVSWDKARKKWQVHIQINGKAIALGRYTDFETAKEVYRKAAQKYFGEFACHE